MNLFVPRDKPLTSPVVGGLIILSAAAIALMAGAVLMLMMGADPLTGYRELILGIVGSKHSISEVLLKAVPLLILGLGVAVAFNASLWNIGAEGQFYMGALAAAWLALVLSFLPWYLLTRLIE